MGAVLAAGQFYGEVAVRRVVGGLILTETRYGADASFPRHSHDLAYFSLLVTGAHVEEVGRREIGYRPFAATFHPVGEEHSGQVRGGSRLFVVEFDRSWMAREGGPELVAAGGPPPAGAASAGLAVRLYHEFLQDDECSPLAVESLACEMLAAARQPPAAAARPRWLARVEDLLHEADGRVDLASLAEEAGVHPMHVTRVFRRHHGVSPGAFRRRLKIEAACASLARPGSSLADVAAVLGFTDQSHFTRTFKAATGLTPGRFRDAALGRRARAAREASGVQDGAAGRG